MSNTHYPTNTVTCQSAHKLLLKAVSVVLILALSFTVSHAQTLELSRDHLNEGHYEAAVTAALAILADEPDSADAKIALGHAHLATGDIDFALQTFEQAAGKALETLTTQDVDIRIDAAFQAIRLRYLFRDPTGAMQQLARLHAIYQRREATDAATSFEETLAMGEALRLLSRADASLTNTALQTFETAIGQQPEDPRGHIAIGNLLLDRFNNAEASRAFTTAIALAPLSAEALLGRARSQRFEHSANVNESIRQVLEVNPNSVEALALLARQYIEVENYEAAEIEIDRALDINPRSLSATTLKAAVLFLRGDRVPFDTLVQRVRSEAPGYSELFETLAEIAAQNRRYRDAAGFALFAINFYEHSWRGHALLGINRLRLGHMQHGRSHLENAFSGDPYDIWTKNTLDLLDLMESFSVQRSKRFELVAPANEIAILAPRLFPVAERAYDVFAQKYQHKIGTPIRIELFDRHEDFSVRTVGLVGVDIVGVSFGPVIALDSPSGGIVEHFNWASVIWHEIAHSFHLSLSARKVPRWFSEGLAVFEERVASPGWGNDVSPGFLAAFKDDRLYPASELNLSFLRPRYPNQVIHAYFQAYLLFELIDRDHNFDAIVDMLRGYADGRSTNEMIADLYGLSISEFDTYFNDYIRTRFATPLNALFGPVAGDTDQDENADPKDGLYQQLSSNGIEALREGDLDKAENLLKEAQALFPDHAGESSTYHRLADTLSQRGDIDGAIVQLERNLAIDADDFSALGKLIALYQEAGNDDDTIDSINRALLVEPFDASLHATLANLLTDAERWPEAVESRLAVVELNPTDPVKAHYELADALSRSGNFDEAKTQLLKALEDAPMYEEALELLLQIREQQP